MRSMLNLTKRLLAGVLLLSGAMTFAQDAPAIAAASDLKYALDEIAAKFQHDTGAQLRISYGSSGNFTRQIAQDAPFELFLSADEAYVFQLAAQNRTLDRGVLYASGRIVLFVPLGSTLKPDAQLADLRVALADGRIARFAIANPEHAPYGRAAMQALQSAGLWEQIQPHLVLGENVSQAAQFAVSGSAQGGIFAYSLALAPAFATRGQYVLLAQSLHQPLRQRMVLTRKAGNTARAFYRYLQQDAARVVFKRYGFLLPGETAG
ncbi:MAG: molybdate ABC transporter substrate-binding protein [Betaproteobacteria bacterium]